MTATISVLVPAYNGAKYLQDCLVSVLAQTHHDWQLIVVDDCSNDDTLQIAQAFANRDPRVRVAQNARNLGLVANWNRCLELADAEWIKFLFQDDVLAPRCLEAMLTAARPEAPLIACRRNFLFEGGVPNIERRYYMELPTVDTIFGGTSAISSSALCDAAIEHFGVNFIGEPTSMMIQRGVFSRFGPFDARFIAIPDTEYWIRVGSQTGLVYVPETLAQFRVHGASTTARNFASRAFGVMLDFVVLLDKYAHDEAYRALRDAARRRTPPVEFADMLLDRAREARWSALEMIATRKAPEALAEWERFLEAYPRVADALARSELGSLGDLDHLGRDGLHCALLAAHQKISELQRTLAERDGKVRRLESQIDWITNRRSYKMFKNLQRLIARR